MLPLGLKCFGTIFTSNKLVNLIPGDCRVLTDSHMALVIAWRRQSKFLRKNDMNRRNDAGDVHIQVSSGPCLRN